MMRLVQLGIVFFLLAGGSLCAETISPAPLPGWGASTTQASPVAGFGNVVLTATALVIFVGVGLYFIKNGALPFRSQSGADRKLHVRETRMLGNRQFLVVVEYEENKILLGVTPGKIDYLCALEGKPASPANFGEIMVNSDREPAGEKL